jgi:hypothetical protein
MRHERIENALQVLRAVIHNIPPAPAAIAVIMVRLVIADDRAGGSALRPP